MKQRLVQAVDGVACLILASLLHVAVFGGFTVRLGGFKVSAHDVVPLALQLAIVLALRWAIAGSPFGGLFARAIGIARRVREFTRRNRSAVVGAAGLVVVAITCVAVFSPRQGLTGRYFDNPTWNGQPFLTVRDREPTLARTAPPWFHDNFSIEWTGVIHLARPGEYLFALESDDGATLRIDDELVVDNSGPHGIFRSEGARTLDAGFHSLRLRFDQTVGGFALRAAWTPVEEDGVASREQSLSSALLFPETPGPLAFALFQSVSLLARLAEFAVATMLAAALLVCADVIRSDRGALGRAARRIRRAASRIQVRRQALRRMVVASTAGFVIVATVIEIAASFGHGLNARYYSTADATGEPFLITIDSLPRRDRFAYDFVEQDGVASVVWTGVIHFAAPGDYNFAIHSRTPARLFIDGALVIERSSPSDQPAIASIRAMPGFHLLRIEYSDDREIVAPFAVQWSLGSEHLRPIATADVLRASPQRNSSALAWFHLSSRVHAIAPSLGFVALGLLGFLAMGRRQETGSPHATRRPGLLSAEPLSHFVILAGLVSLYIWAGWTRSPLLWGFASLGAFAPLRDPGAFGWIAFAVGLVLFVADRGVVPLRAFVGRASSFFSRSSVAIPTMGVVAALVFFWFRSGFLNSDGASYRWMTPDLIDGHFSRSIDEMWERHLHAWFWWITNATFGWSVRTSYQVASSIAGGVFVATLWWLARRLAPAAPRVFMALVLGGGFMQLFFGDVEHYSLVAAAMLIYFVFAVRFIRGEIGLVAPTAVLAIAMSLHMLAGFLLPSVGVLYVMALRRRAFGQLVLATAAAAGVIVGTMVVLGIPMSATYQGSWGTQAIRRLLGSVISADGFGEGAVGLEKNWAFFRFDAYHRDQYNLLALMFPGHLVLLLLAAWRRLRLDAVNVFLLAATLGMAFFQFNYRAMLPISHDWNLYANAAIPAAILAWRNLIGADIPARGAIAAGWISVSWAHSLAWILSNHRFQP